jgi:hypothetical protein
LWVVKVPLSLTMFCSLKYLVGGQGVTWSNFTWSNQLIEFFDQTPKKLSLDQKFY